MSKKLTELNPQWVGYGGEGVSDKNGNPIPRREKVAISFNCPCGCGEPTIVEFENPEDGLGPISQHNWHREGDSFENLTLTPSLQKLSGCRWHGYITNGEAHAV